MGNMNSHGVVVVMVKSGKIHRPESGGTHGLRAMRSEDWELFPSLHTALEADYLLCRKCFANQGLVSLQSLENARGKPDSAPATGRVYTIPEADAAAAKILEGETRRLGA